MNGEVTAPITFGPWIPNHHNSCIRTTTTRYPGKPVITFSIGDITVLMTSNTVKPKHDAINPTIDTQRIVIIIGNNTANDCDTFGGTESGREIFNLPESTNLT